MSFFLKNNSNNLFVIFIVGVIVSYGIFTFVQQSDRKVIVDSQLDAVEEQIARAENIYTNCQSLYQSGEKTPQSVRETCVTSQEFVAWIRGFSYDTKLKRVKASLLPLAETIEDMSWTFSQYSNAIEGKRLLESTPTLIDTVKNEVSKVRRKMWF